MLPTEVGVDSVVPPPSKEEMGLGSSLESSGATAAEPAAVISGESEQELRTNQLEETEILITRRAIMSRPSAGPTCTTLVGIGTYGARIKDRGGL